ncbi:MAG: cbb3-type cytochrome oxidase assembly protein CcoS [Proteobacteria bacterium]|jgi:cbb3-type cytochrome oxidase maturation protein|nr:cbb3-type cytochrome oxidase assembly protein CcoS [Pseudomonadota bacterium]
MSGFALIIAAAFGFGLCALVLLLWALGSGQYDDLEGEANRILLDEDEE